MNSFLPLLACCCCMPLSAAVYHVAVKGNDANPCTQKAPCLTIAKAGQLAKPGDTVRVGPGEYPERVTLRRGGSEAGGPVRFEGHDGSGCPVEKIDDIHSRGERPKPKVSMKGWVVAASFLQLDCFEVAGIKETAVEIKAAQGNLEVSNFSIHDASSAVNMARVALEQLAHDLVFRNNYVTQTSYGFLVFCGKKCLFEDNEVERNVARAAGADMDYSRLFGEDIVFRRNYFHGNRASDCQGCHIDCFQTWNVNGSVYEFARRITIDGNVCFNAHQGVIANDTNGREVASHKDWVVTNNIFNYGPEGSRMAWCALFTHVGNILFAHNLCGTGIAGYRKGSDSTHVNNIHYQTGLKPYVAETGSTVRGANNLMFNASRPYMRAGFPRDVLNMDPGFVNPAQGDYRLRPGSAAIGRGAVTSVRQDRFGRPRTPGSLPDIGPYQGPGGGRLEGKNAP